MQQRVSIITEKLEASKAFDKGLFRFRLFTCDVLA